MTQEELILCADASGISLFAMGMDRKEFLRRLDVFANLVAAKATEEANARANASWTLMCKKMVALEREACAKLCDELKPFGFELKLQRATADDCATAIRARGEA